MSIDRKSEAASQLLRELHNTRARVRELEKRLHQAEHVAAEHHRVEEQLRQQVGDLALLVETSTAISSLPSVDRTLQVIAQNMTRVLSLDGCFISFWDRDRGILRTLLSHPPSLAPSTAEPPGTVRSLLKDPLSHRVLNERQAITVCVNDPQADLEIRERMRRLHVQSLLIVPMVVRRKVIGQIELMDTQRERSFGPADIRLCEALANQAAAALENARLHTETQRRVQEQVALAKASAAILSTLDLETVLTRIAEQMTLLVDATSAVICSYDPDTAQSTALAQYVTGRASPEERSRELGTTHIERDSAFVEAMRTNRVFLREMPGPQTWESQPRSVSPSQGKTILYAPMWFKGHVTGYAEIWEGRTKRVFSDEEIRLCCNVAQQAAIALQNARLFEQAQREIYERGQKEEELSRRNQELALLNRVIAESAAHENTESMLEAMSRELAEALGCPYVAAALLDDTRTVATVVAEHPIIVEPSMVGSKVPLDEVAAVEPVLRYQTPMIIENVRTDERLSSVRRLFESRPISSLLIVPLVVDSQTVGILVGSDPPREISVDELRLAWRVAEQASNALTQIRLRERQRSLEEQLRQAQKMEALGQMAGGVAHDFNNLLTIMRVSSQLMERRIAQDDPLWENLQHLSTALDRATDLTGRLLSFSRKEIVEAAPLNLNRIIEQLEPMLRRVLGESIELVCNLASDLWPVKTDSTQMHQILVNLVLNGRNAMNEGGTLTIETANVILDKEYADSQVDASPGPHVMLVVSDTGIGMDDEVKNHLFEPFFTTGQKGRGTGLGLATIYGIVKQHRGHIRIQSEMGVGSTFRIYLPRCQEKAMRTESSHQWIPPERVQGRETILVAEDEPIVRGLAQEILKDHGYRVLAATDGLHALELARQHDGAIDLLLTDVVMPRMNGRDLAERLCAHHPETRVLYMSGYTDNVVLQRDVLDRGVTILPKPLTLESLLHKVREILDAAAAESSD